MLLHREKETKTSLHGEIGSQLWNPLPHDVACWLWKGLRDVDGGGGLLTATGHGGCFEPPGSKAAPLSVPVAGKSYGHLHPLLGAAWFITAGARGGLIRTYILKMLLFLHAGRFLFFPMGGRSDTATVRELNDTTRFLRRLCRPSDFCSPNQSLFPSFPCPAPNKT